MSVVSCYARRISRLRSPKYPLSSRWVNSSLRLFPPASRRHFDDGRTLAIEEELTEHGKLNGRIEKKVWDEYRTCFNLPPPNFEFLKCIPSSLIGTTVTAVGFLGKPKNLGAGMTFVNLEGGNGPEQIQVLARAEFNDDARRVLRKIKPNSAVCVVGVLHLKYEAKDTRDLGVPEAGTEFIHNLEIRLESVKTLNSFTRHFHPGSMTDPRERDLHIRFDKALRQRLKFRSDVASFARRELADFQEIETPILFKSTPEGAREFIVPTRNKGLAYGLPQSPQQYKQILMATGINRYVQFAKCFRDEDHRADRQPEFTQIDLEIAWADGEQVMQRVERFVKALWGAFTGRGVIRSPLPDAPLMRMTYDEAMSKHGSDKPDLRIPGEIQRIDRIIPADLRGMLTSIEDPILEVFKIRLDDTRAAQMFIREFMDSPEAEPFKENVDGAPGVFVFDPRRPLEGLQAFGFEGAENLKALYTDADKLDSGDVLLVQARPNAPHSGGSTIVGKLRLAIYRAAVAKGLIVPDPTHHFLWVTDFPMFTPDNATDPGQGGSSGFSATHHPFTAPKTSDDLDLLLTDPLKAKADHYDLVLNGVELGGGSRRIHSSAIQKFIMRDILKMPQSRMDDFKHLFRALEAGCPPHAGLAIGFDRLIAVMQDRDTVRDVIAFPKNSNGEDPMVESPGPIHRKELAAYHLQVLPRDRLDVLKEQPHAKDSTMREQQKAIKGVKEQEGVTEIQTPVDDGQYLRQYFDDLKVLPRDRPEVSPKSFTPIEKSRMQEYIEALKNPPSEKVEAIEDFNQPQSSAAVMVADFDAMKTYLTDVVSPSLKSVLLNPDMVASGQVQLPELTGLVGESTLDTMKLERKATAREKGAKTAWGQKLEEVKTPSSAKAESK